MNSVARTCKVDRKAREPSKAGDSGIGFKALVGTVVLLVAIALATFHYYGMKGPPATTKAHAFRRGRSSTSSWKTTSSGFSSFSYSFLVGMVLAPLGAIAFVRRKKILVDDRKCRGNDHEGVKGEDKGEKKPEINNDDEDLSRLLAHCLQVLHGFLMVSLKHLCDRVLTVIVDLCLESHNSQVPLVEIIKSKIEMASANSPAAHARAMKLKPKPIGVNNTTSNYYSSNIPKPITKLLPHNATRIATGANAQIFKLPPAPILGFAIVVSLAAILVVYRTRIFFRQLEKGSETKKSSDSHSTASIEVEADLDPGVSPGLTTSPLHEHPAIDESPSESTAVDVPLEATVDVNLASGLFKAHRVDSITPFASPYPHPHDNETLGESSSRSPVADLTLALAATVDVDSVVLVPSPPRPDENQVNSDDSIAELWTLHPHPPEECEASTLDVALPVAVAVDVHQLALPASLSLPLRPVCEDHEVDFDVDDTSMVSWDGAVDGLVVAQLGLSGTATTQEPDDDDDEDEDHYSTPLERSLNSDHDYNHDSKDEDEDKNDDDDDDDDDDDVKLALGIPLLGYDDNGGSFHVEAVVETADVQAIDMDTFVVSAVQTTQPTLSSDEEDHDASEVVKKAQVLSVPLPDDDDDDDDDLAVASHVPLPMDLEGDLLSEGDDNEKLGVDLRTVVHDEGAEDVRRTEGDGDDDHPCEMVLSVIRPCTPLPGGTEADNGNVLKGHGDDLALRIPLPDDDADEDSIVHVTSYPDSLPLPEDRKADVEGDDNDENMLFHTHVWRSVEELGQHAIGIGKQQLGPSRSRVLDLRLAMGSSPPPLPPPPQGIIARPVFLGALYQPPTGMAVSSSSSRPPLPLPLSFDTSYASQPSMLMPRPRPRPDHGSGAGQHVFRPRPRPRGATIASYSSTGTQIQHAHNPSSIPMRKTLEPFRHAPPIRPIYETSIGPVPVPASVSVPHLIPGPSTFSRGPPAPIFPFNEPNYSRMLGAVPWAYPFPGEPSGVYDGRAMNVGSSCEMPHGASAHTFYGPFETAPSAYPPPPRAPPPPRGRLHMDFQSSMLSTESPSRSMPNINIRPSALSFDGARRVEWERQLVERRRERERNEEWAQIQEVRRLRGVINEEWMQERQLTKADHEGCVVGETAEANGPGLHSHDERTLEEIRRHQQERLQRRWKARCERKGLVYYGPRRDDTIQENEVMLDLERTAKPLLGPSLNEDAQPFVPNFVSSIAYATLAQRGIR